MATKREASVRRQLLEQVRATTVKLTITTEAADAAFDAQTEAMRAARNGGVPVTDIGNASGIGRKAVYKRTNG